MALCFRLGQYRRILLQVQLNTLFKKVHSPRIGTKSLDMSLVEEHGTKRTQLITSCALPEVTTVSTGLVFHELSEKNIFDF